MKTLLNQAREILCLPFEILRVLRSIDRRLELFERLVDKHNHRGRLAVRVAHWND